VYAKSPWMSIDTWANFSTLEAFIGNKMKCNMNGFGLEPTIYTMSQKRTWFNQL